MTTQENASTFLVNFEGGSPSAKDLKEALEKGDTPTRIDTLKKIIMLQLNGEPQNHLIMPVIRFCVPCEDHTVKKLLIYYWECVDKTDPSTGSSLPEIILLCEFLRNDLRSPNEYIRGVTLRFLCKVREKDVLEPLLGPIVDNLSHKVTYVRRNAVCAINSIYAKFPDLLPDAPEIIDRFLEDEADPSSRRHAFCMLFQHAQDRAIRCLLKTRDTGDPSSQGDVFLLSAVDLIKKLIIENPHEKSKFIPLIYAILNSKNPAVLFQCASTLLALSTSPTAIRQATGTLIHLLSTHSDNNVRFVVLDRLTEMKGKFLNVLQESLMDVLRGLSTTGNAEVRERILDFCADLVTTKNIEAFIVFMKKELVRSQSDDVGDHDAQQKYRQQLVRVIHTSVLEHIEFAPMVVPVMLDHLCDSGAASHDVALFIREVMHHKPELREEVLTQLAANFQLISSPKVFRTVLWLYGVHCRTKDQICAVIQQVKQALEPLPLAPAESTNSGGDGDNDNGPSTVTTTAVREDGTYVMNIQLVNKRVDTERSDLAGLRAQIVGGDFFLAAALCNTLSKLTVQLFSKASSTASGHDLPHGVQADCVEIMREIIRYGTSAAAAQHPLDDDTHERIRLAMTVCQNPRNEFLISIVNDSIEAFNVTLAQGRALEDQARSLDDKKKGKNKKKKSAAKIVKGEGNDDDNNAENDNADEEAEAGAIVEMGDIDAPLVFTQLSRGKQALMEFQTADDTAAALSDNAIGNQMSLGGGAGASHEDFVARLHRVKQLSGFSDPVYCEAMVTVHQFDIQIELFLVNQTDDMLSNLTVELTTMGDLKLCERPQTFHMPPGSSVSTKATIKVSSTETGLIHGNVVFDPPHDNTNSNNSNDRGCVILNEINVDIMDYIRPSTCSPAAFRGMWTEFEWENKVTVNTDIRDLKQFVETVMAQTNMRNLDEFAASTAESGYLSASLYAKSTFGEDALANVSVELTEEGRVEGVVRVRSKTQGIALGLGDKVSIKQKSLSSSSGSAGTAGTTSGSKA